MSAKVTRTIQALPDPDLPRISLATGAGARIGRVTPVITSPIGGPMKRLTTLAVVAILTAGCAAPAATTGPAPTTASEKAQEVTPTPVTMGPGEYEFQPLTGGTGTLSIPGTPVADLEELRALVKGKPVKYLTIAMDNREGSADVHVGGVSLFTPAGDEVKYQPASDYADELGKLLPQDAPAETSNRFITAYNKYNDPVKPLAKGTVTLVGPTPPAEFTGVKVYDAYGDPVDALPKS